MELNGKYVNDETYKKGKAFFKKLGWVFIGIGVALVIVGIVLMVVSSTMGDVDMGDAGWFDSQSKKSSISFAGYACLAFGVFGVFAGIAMFVQAHRREILAYGASTVLPVAGEVVEQSAPVVADSLGKVVKSVKDAIVDENAKQKASSVKVCDFCKTENSNRNKYCKNCGKELAKKRFCHNCGDEISPDENFCENCGTQVKKSN